MSAPFRSPLDLELGQDPRQLARWAKLKYVSDDSPGFSRRRCGRGFVYLDHQGTTLKDDEHLGRIESLVLPPAWADVWICSHHRGHLQATGRDEKGRKQYRYHDHWSQAANWQKFARLRSFGSELPKIRSKIRRDLRSSDDRTRTLALMAALLDATAMRVGNREYAEENEHYGLTTLLDEHVTVSGDEARFEFVGKSGKEREVTVTDRTIVKRLRELLKRKGERLFEVRNDDGSYVPAEAEHLNEYLRDLMPPGCTAKTFRTWHGTVTAFDALVAACDRGEGSVTEAIRQKNGKPGLTTKAIEKTLRDAIKASAAYLGNTTTVCKTYYVHPALCDLYREAKFATHLNRLRFKPRRGMKQSEQRLLALLHRVERGRR